MLEKNLVKLTKTDHVIALQYAIDEMQTLNEGLQHKLKYFHGLFNKKQQLKTTPLPVFPKTLIPPISDALAHINNHLKTCQVHTAESTSDASSPSVITIDSDSSVSDH